MLYKNHFFRYQLQLVTLGTYFDLRKGGVGGRTFKHLFLFWLESKVSQLRHNLTQTCTNLQTSNSLTVFQKPGWFKGLNLSFRNYFSKVHTSFKNCEKFVKKVFKLLHWLNHNLLCAYACVCVRTHKRAISSLPM